MLDTLVDAETVEPGHITWPDSDERLPSSTVGGDYALPSIRDEADEEARSWAELARRARERWAKENPF